MFFQPRRKLRRHRRLLWYKPRRPSRSAFPTSDFALDGNPARENFREGLSIPAHRTGIASGCLVDIARFNVIFVSVIMLGLAASAASTCPTAGSSRSETATR